MSYSPHYRFQTASMRPRITMAVQRLILLNVIVFAAQLIISIPLGAGIHEPPGGLLIPWLAFRPGWFIRGALWMPFTYIFLHAGLLHLFLNMLWLYFFGPEVERILSTQRFYRFFLYCGAVGVMATFLPWLMSGGRDLPVVGASGAVMGVMVAYAMINPDREFYLFPLPVPINARALVFFVVIMNIMSALSGGNTSVSTHFGGMGAGYLYMKYAPTFRRTLEDWRRSRETRKAKPADDDDDDDPVGEAVDNVFRFDKEKRRRRP